MESPFYKLRGQHAPRLVPAGAGRWALTAMPGHDADGPFAFRKYYTRRPNPAQVEADKRRLAAEQGWSIEIPTGFIKIYPADLPILALAAAAAKFPTTLPLSRAPIEVADSAQLTTLAQAVLAAMQAGQG